MRLVERDNGLSRATAMLLLATIAMGLLHHVDHILRVDHSGWPFRSDVTPFTFSLLAYPVLLFALFGPSRLFWLRWIGMAAGTAFTIYAHASIESPRMQYAMWAYNRSLEPELWAVRNMCGVQSGAIGIVAVLVAMALNVLLVLGLFSMLADRPRRRAVAGPAR